MQLLYKYISGFYKFKYITYFIFLVKLNYWYFWKKVTYALDDGFLWTLLPYVVVVNMYFCSGYFTVVYMSHLSWKYILFFCSITMNLKLDSNSVLSDLFRGTSEKKWKIHPRYLKWLDECSLGAKNLLNFQVKVWD